MGLDLKRAALNGALWSLVQAWGVRVITLVHFVVIARLLEPADLGIIAFAGALIACFATLVDQGMALHIESRADASPEVLDTAWWSTSVAGLLTTILIACLAPWLAGVTGKVYLLQLLPVMAVTVLISALSCIQLAVLKARFLHKRIAVANLVSTVVGAVLGIAAAWQGFAYWALVIKAVVEASITTAYLIWQSPWRPGRRWQRATWFLLLKEGWPVVGMRLLDIVNQRLDTLLIGGRWGPAVLGVYATGQRIYQIAMEALFSAVNQISLPVFGRVSERPEQAGALLLRIVRLASLVTFPTFGLGAAAGPEIVVLVFGQRWEAAGPVFAVFCLGGMLFSVSYFNAPLMLACGRSRQVLMLTSLNAATNALAFWLALPYGATAVAAAFVVRGYLVYPVNLYFLKKTTKLPIFRYLNALVPAAIATAFAMTLCFLAVLAKPLDSLLANTVLALMLGAVSFVCVLLVFFRRILLGAVAEFKMS